MDLEIITPEKKIFEGEIDSIKVPGSSGSFTVLRNHAPIVSTLEAGEITLVTKSAETKNFKVSGGVIEVHDNKVVVLADI